VLDMTGVDLDSYIFDYDLTFAALLMNGDGTIYHRYGARDHISATSRMSMTSLVRLLGDSLEDHRAHVPSPALRAAVRLTPERIPPLERKIAARRRERPERDPEKDCIHCHTVHDAVRDHAREQGHWSREETLAMWPLPEKVGLVLDIEDPSLVRAVLPGSAASAAGLLAGDRLVRLGTQRVRTHADVQWVLHRAPAEGAMIPARLVRAEKEVAAELAPAPGWKMPTDLEFSWRASMWSLDPKPGFGGKKLAPDELAELGLARDAFALRIGYIVDWGDEAFTGESARRAGLREGDVVLSVAGRKDFATETHFQTWFRFTQTPGTKARTEILRGGERIEIGLPVLPAKPMPEPRTPSAAPADPQATSFPPPHFPRI
jgi:hypothetical protein